MLDDFGDDLSTNIQPWENIGVGFCPRVVMWGFVVTSAIDACIDVIHGVWSNQGGNKSEWWFACSGRQECSL